jgi:hypothetical protein
MRRREFLTQLTPNVFLNADTKSPEWVFGVTET